MQEKWKSEAEDRFTQDFHKAVEERIRLENVAAAEEQIMQARKQAAEDLLLNEWSSRLDAKKAKEAVAAAEMQIQTERKVIHKFGATCCRLTTFSLFLDEPFAALLASCWRYVVNSAHIRSDPHHVSTFEQ